MERIKCVIEANERQEPGLLLTMITISFLLCCITYKLFVLQYIGVSRKKVPLLIEILVEILQKSQFVPDIQ